MATKLPYVLPFEDGSVVAAILLKAQGLPETEQIATKTELQQATAYLATLDNATMAPQSAAVKRATDDLQAQINNIVRAPESGGDVGAEVYQARVDENSVTFLTLKDRLDFHDLRTAAISAELGPIYQLKANTYVNKDTGAEGSISGYVVTDYVPILNGVAVRTRVADDYAGICFYDEAKRYISGYNPYSDNETLVDLTIPDGAVYVRVSCGSSYQDNFICRYKNCLSGIVDLLEDSKLEISNLSTLTDYLNQELNGGIYPFTAEWVEGYYVSNVNHTLVPLSGWHTTELIFLNAGDTIRILGARSSTASAVDLLSRWADTGSYVESLIAYSTTSETDVEYTAASDMYVRISSIPIPTLLRAGIGVIAQLGLIDTQIEDINDDIEELAENGISYVSSDISPTIVDGQYINYRGRIKTLAAYCYTESYELHRGDTVVITSRDPSGNSVSRISCWTQGGSYIKTVSLGTTTVTTDSYTASEEVEYIRFSYVKSVPPSVLQVKTLTVSEGFQTAVNALIDAKIEPDPDYTPDYSISMFESVAFCGDSYVKGQLYNSQGLIGDRPNLSWGACLSRISGVGYSIDASSGADTNTWQSRANCLPKALSEPAKGLYIFCLGINDTSYVTLGTIDDIHPDYTTNPNTFYGNYGRIIEQIQNHAPNSKIILMTPYHPSYNARYVTPLEEISEHYGIAMINTRDSKLCQASGFTSLLVGGHPTAPLHSAIAADVNKLIQKCIHDNYAYFKDYPGV